MRATKLLSKWKLYWDPKLTESNTLNDDWVNSLITNFIYTIVISLYLLTFTLDQCPLYLSNEEIEFIKNKNKLKKNNNDK